MQLISSVVTQNWKDIVQSCELDNWKEALAALLTYAHPEDFARLCGKLLRSCCGLPRFQANCPVLNDTCFSC